jgi:molybdopterin converting factor small subunit
MAGSVVVGVSVFLLSDGLVSTQILKNTSESLVASVNLPTDGVNDRASLITVRVFYTMMAQYTDLNEEDFVLQSPAVVEDLLNTCIVRHPSLAEMMSTMLILLNGVPSRPSAPLRDGDTVQLIPLTAGG